MECQQVASKCWNSSTCRASSGAGLVKAFGASARRLLVRGLLLEPLGRDSGGLLLLFLLLLLLLLLLGLHYQKAPQYRWGSHGAMRSISRHQVLQPCWMFLFSCPQTAPAVRLTGPKAARSKVHGLSGSQALSLLLRGPGEDTKVPPQARRPTRTRTYQPVSSARVQP